MSELKASNSILLERIRLFEERENNVQFSQYFPGQDRSTTTQTSPPPSCQSCTKVLNTIGNIQCQLEDVQGSLSLLLRASPQLPLNPTLASNSADEVLLSRNLPHYQPLPAAGQASLANHPPAVASQPTCAALPAAVSRAELPLFTSPPPYQPLAAAGQASYAALPATVSGAELPLYTSPPPYQHLAAAGQASSFNLPPPVVMQATSTVLPASGLALVSQPLPAEFQVSPAILPPTEASQPPPAAGLSGFQLLINPAVGPALPASLPLPGPADLPADSTEAINYLEEVTPPDLVASKTDKTQGRQHATQAKRPNVKPRSSRRWTSPLLPTPRPQVWLDYCVPPSSASGNMFLNDQSNSRKPHEAARKAQHASGRDTTRSAGRERNGSSSRNPPQVPQPTEELLIDLN